MYIIWRMRPFNIYSSRSRSLYFQFAVVVVAVAIVVASSAFDGALCQAVRACVLVSQRISPSCFEKKKKKQVRHSSAIILCERKRVFNALSNDVDF